MAAGFMKFLSETSCHGLQLAGKAKSKYSICFWLALSFVGVCFILNRIKFMSDEINDCQVFYATKVHDGPVPFPAVTVCNINPYMRSRARNIPQIAAIETISYNVTQGKPIGKKGKSNRRKRAILDCDQYIINTGDAAAFQYQDRCFVIEKISETSNIVDSLPASDACKTNGGRLAWIEDQATYDAVKSQMDTAGAVNYALTGLMQQSNAGSPWSGWYFQQPALFGSPKSATSAPWNSGEPNDWGTTTDSEDNEENFGCASRFNAGYADIDAYRHFICEYEFETWPAQTTEPPVTTSTTPAYCDQYIINTGNAVAFQYQDWCFVVENVTVASYMYDAVPASNACESKGGRLAWIEDQATLDAVRGQIIAAGTNDALTGLKQRASAVNLTEDWYFEQPAQFGQPKPASGILWYSGEPNDNDGTLNIEDHEEDLGCLTSNHPEFVDKKDYKAFVCEYAPGYCDQYIINTGDAAAFQYQDRCIVIEKTSGGTSTNADIVPAWNACESKGGRLAWVEDQATFDFVTNQLTAANATDRALIGLMQQANSTTPSDGWYLRQPAQFGPPKPANGLPWHTGLPKDTDGIENNEWNLGVVLNKFIGIADRPTYRHFLCEYEFKRWTPDTTDISIPTSATPNDRLVASNDCESKGGRLAWVEDWATFDNVQAQLALHSATGYVLTGLKQQDDSPAPGARWYLDQPPQFGPIKWTIGMPAFPWFSTGDWNLVETNNHNLGIMDTARYGLLDHHQYHHFLCEYEFKQSTPLPAYCDQYIIKTGNAVAFEYDGRCFVIEMAITTTYSFDPVDASNDCNSKGGRLAWIEDQAAFDYVQGKLATYGVTDHTLLGLKQRYNSSSPADSWYWRQPAHFGPDKSASDLGSALPIGFGDWDSTEDNEYNLGVMNTANAFIYDRNQYKHFLCEYEFKRWTPQTTDFVMTTSISSKMTSGKPTTSDKPSSSDQSISSEKPSTTGRPASSNEAQTSIEYSTSSNEPPTTEKPTSSDEQPTTEKPTSSDEPPTTEKPTSSDEQPTTEKPTSSDEPPTTEKPTSSDEPPTTTEKPTSSDEPPTTEKPTSLDEPLTTTEKPTSSEEPPTSEKPTSSDEPPTTEKQTSSDGPPTTEKPTSSDKPPTTEKPTSSDEQPTTEKPTSSVKPPTTEKPTSSDEQPTTEKPTSSDKPPTTEKPTSSYEPPTTEKPTSSDKPPTTEKPTSSDEPPTTEKPTSSDKPPTTEKPTSSDEPPTTEEPTRSDEPSTTEKPTSSDEPPTTEKPTSSDKPPTTEKPTTAGQPASTFEPPTTDNPSTTIEPLTTDRSTSINKPPTTEQPTSSDEPPTTAEQPATDESPTTVEEPTSSIEPPTTGKPTSSEEPPTTEKLTNSDDLPTTVEQPTSKDEPLTSVEQPASSDEPPTTDKLVNSNQKPQTSDKPASSIEPATTDKPANLEESQTTGHLASPDIALDIDQPASSDESSVTQQPARSEKSATSGNQTSMDKPPTRYNEIVIDKPTTRDPMSSTDKPPIGVPMFSSDTLPPTEPHASSNWPTGLHDPLATSVGATLLGKTISIWHHNQHKTPADQQNNVQPNSQVKRIKEIEAEKHEKELKENNDQFWSPPEGIEAEEVKQYFQKKEEAEIDVVSLLEENLFESMGEIMDNSGNDDFGGVSKKPDASSLASTLSDALPLIMDQISADLRQKLGIQKEEMFYRCTYDNKECNIEKWDEFAHPKYGNCFTFNNGGSRMVKRASGDLGLSIMLRLWPSQYLHFIENSGVVIDIHNPMQQSFPEAFGFTISGGKHTEIVLERQMVTKLQNCNDMKNETDESYIFPHAYSLEGCLQSCTQQEMNKFCFCMDPKYPPLKGRNDTKTCPIYRKACMDEFYKRSASLIQGNCKHCEIPCKDFNYRSVMTQRKWPVGSSMLELCPSTIDISGKDGIDKCNRFIEKEFLSLHINVQKTVQYEMQEKFVYTASSMVSQMGCWMSIMLGASVLTCIELVIALAIGLKDMFLE